MYDERCGWFSLEVLDVACTLCSRVVIFLLSVVSVCVIVEIVCWIVLCCWVNMLGV